TSGAGLVKGNARTQNVTSNRRTDQRFMEANRNEQPKPSQGTARKAGRKGCPFRGASVPVSRLLRSLAPPKAYPCRLEHCCCGGSGRANETPASGAAPERESERETPTQKKTMTKNMNIRSKNVRTQRRRRVGERRCVRRRHRWSQCQ